MHWGFKWEWFDGVELVFHLESSSCSGWEFLAFYQFWHIWSMVVVFNVIFALLEVLEFVGVFVGGFGFLFSETIDRFSIELTFAGIVQFLASFFQTSDISPFESAIFEFCVRIWHFGDIGRGVELAAKGSLIDLKSEYLLISVYKVLILFFIFKAILEWIAFDIFPFIDGAHNLCNNRSNFFDVWPKIWLYFGEDKHVIDPNFEGSVSRIGYNFSLLLVIIAMQAEREWAGVIDLRIIRWWLISVDFYLLWIFEEGVDFRFQFIIEFHIFVLVVPGAPIVEVAINAMLNLDMHHD